MRTLVVSDLHLGSRSEADVLRDPAARDALLRELDGADRLVLLGDALELRHGPVPQALEAARDAFRAIGEALGPRAEVVLVAGNHDHAIVAPWLERRAVEGEEPLGLAETTKPEGLVAATLAGWLGAGRTRLAYPGIWLRDDVFAIHGHYLDRHVTIPTFERLAAGAMGRVVGEMPEDRATPEDYEAVLAPLYAWLHVVSRYTKLGFERQKGTQNAWRLLTDSGPRPLRDRALVAAFPMAVRVLNMLKVGPVGTDLSPAELRRSGLKAMAESCRRLGIAAEWVLFGHTHRAGPLDRDDVGEWQVPGGPRLMNTGCWVHERVFLGDSGPRSPYWPGTVVEVGDDGPPRLRNVLPEYRLPD
ncbi:MAG TPA: metallophosphoesterase [Solirubrobacteraceae bacterium]